MISCPYRNICEDYKIDGIKCRDLYHLCEHKFRFDETREEHGTFQLLLELEYPHERGKR